MYNEYNNEVPQNTDSNMPIEGKDNNGQPPADKPVNGSDYTIPTDEIIHNGGEQNIDTPVNNDINMPVEDTNQEETIIEEKDIPTPVNTDINMPVSNTDIAAKETGTSKDDVKYSKVLYNDDKTNQPLNEKVKTNTEIDPEIIYYGCIEKIARDFIKTGKMNVAIIPYKILKQMTDMYKQTGQLDTNIDEVQFFINQINIRIEEIKNNEQKRTI